MWAASYNLMWFRAVKDKEAPSRAGVEFCYADARGPELPEGVLNEIWIPTRAISLNIMCTLTARSVFRLDPSSVWIRLA